MRRVLVPRHPGVLSAWGALSADVRRDYVQTVRLRRAAPRAGCTRRLQPLLGARAGASCAPRVRVARGVRVTAALDVRYRGQSYELAVPLRPRYRAAFHAAHRARYGYADADRPVEVVNLRVTATARERRAHARGAAHRRRPVRSRTALRWNGRWLSARRSTAITLPRARRMRRPAGHHRAQRHHVRRRRAGRRARCRAATSC